MPRARISLILLFLFIPTVAFAGNFKLTSPTIKSGSFISKKYVYNGFGCTGQNLSPALKWKGAPKRTKSFAITIYDPDAPTGSGWWHWIVYNIPANVNEIPAKAGDPSVKMLPPGAEQGPSDYGMHAYGGPCPPKGEKPHRYVFTVYALKVAKINAPSNASAALIGFMIHANMIGKASFTAKYGR
jgi:Raf kinase inhibitor-like YbhB/YbcL family protein